MSVWMGGIFLKDEGGYEIVLKSLVHYKKRLQTIHASPELKEAAATIATPVYTTMCGSDQRNSGEFWIWFMASHIPAARITSDPVTVKIEIIDNCKFDFMQR